MIHTKVHRNQSTGSKEEDFKAFYHIHVWARKPSGHETIFSFSKLTYKICSKKVNLFLRKTSFNSNI